MAFTLPDLPYAYDALEPSIDARTMEIHHTKHHATYSKNLDNAISGHSDLEAMSIEELCAKLAGIPESIRTAVRNHGGGHYNHSLFWSIMAPPGGGSGTPGSTRAPRRPDPGSAGRGSRRRSSSGDCPGSAWSRHTTIRRR